MRRKDRKMPQELALDIADTCEWATISMVDLEGKPYCLPITIVKCDDFLYFHCAKVGKKMDILRKNPDVCVSCVGDTCRATDKFTTSFESALFYGTAIEASDDAEKIMALKALCQRHTPTHMAHFDAAIEKSLHRTVVWRIEISQISGKHKDI